MSKFWVSDTGCFCDPPVLGNHQSVSQDSVWIGCALSPVSDDPESVYVAVSLRCKVGEKEKQTKQNTMAE